MTMRRVGLVAWHVFKESVRDRVLYAIAAFAVLLVAASILIGQITAGQDIKIIKDLGLATIELAGIVMSIFVGIGLVSRDRAAMLLSSCWRPHGKSKVGSRPHRIKAGRHDSTIFKNCC